MRLSEAILLGSTVVTSKTGKLISHDASTGCALGMAAIAGGCTVHSVSGPIPPSERRTLGTEDVWGRWVLATVECPCECSPSQIPLEMRIKDIVAHVFDLHVMQRKDWTLDRLASWVEKLEPKSSWTGNPQPKPNPEHAQLMPPTRPARSVSDWKPDNADQAEQIRNALAAKHLADQVNKEAREWDAARTAFENHHNARRGSRRHPR